MKRSYHVLVAAGGAVALLAALFWPSRGSAVDTVSPTVPTTIDHAPASFPAPLPAPFPDTGAEFYRLLTALFLSGLAVNSPETIPAEATPVEAAAAPADLLMTADAADAGGTASTTAVVRVAGGSGTSRGGLRIGDGSERSWDSRPRIVVRASRDGQMVPGAGWIQ